MTLDIKQYEDIVNDIIERLLTANTNLTDLNESSILRMLIETYSLELESEEFTGIYQKIVEVYEATRISTAADDDLDEIGKIVGVTRKAGTDASTIITLSRTTPALSSFVIAANSIISTQPEAETTQFRFLSVSDETFEPTITDEVQIFIDGIYDYKLVQRFYDEITTLKAIFSSVETLMVEDTNYEEVKAFTGNIVDVDTILVVDECEVTTDWSGSTDATSIAVDATNRRQGTASLKAGKSGTTQTFFSYDKTYVTGVNLTAKTPNLKVRIDSQADLDKLVSITLNLGDSAIDYLTINVNASTLQVGWNDIFFDTDTATAVGTPNINDIKYVNLIFNTNNTSDTIVSGDINFDFIIFCEVESYTGDIIRIIDDGTLPDDSTNLTATYVPLSIEVLSIAEELGSDYNVGIGKLTFKVSALTNITNAYNYSSVVSGEDVEVDDVYRERIIDSTAGLGKATVDSITAAVLALSFVTSANVEDMPIKNDTQVITYSSATDTYQLEHEVAQQNSNLVLTTVRSTANEAIDISETEIDVVDSSDYSTSGFIIIDSEIIAYNGISVNTLQNCVRGSEGSTAATHTITTDVKQWFKPGTDYDITNESKVDWLSNEKPIDTEDFTIYYEYRWLGHINVISNGDFTFTSAQDAEIVAVIEDVKGAGIMYDSISPTIINTNVTADIKLKSGFTFSVVQALVVSALETKLNAYDIAEDIFLSQLIDTIMNIDGVDYTTMSTPASTVVIADSEIAKAGTIVISQI